MEKKLVLFDCDGTLSAIEGIDELARMNDVFDEVSALTQHAMSHTGLSPELFEERLSLVQPTYKQLVSLAELYVKHETPGVRVVMQYLQEQGYTPAVISAGLNPAVKLFAKSLGVSADLVFAVDLHFDAHESYTHFQKDSPLVMNFGKRIIVESLRRKFNHIVYVGDGQNDLQVKNLVDMFIGFGGHFYREKIEAGADHYIREASLLPLLALL